MLLLYDSINTGFNAADHSLTGSKKYCESKITSNHKRLLQFRNSDSLYKKLAKQPTHIYK
jgi:hypothetical protein